MTAAAVVDLPEPDSPTTARVVPRRSSKDTLSIGQEGVVALLGTTDVEFLGEAFDADDASVEVAPLPAPVSSWSAPTAPSPSLR